MLQPSAKELEIKVGNVFVRYNDAGVQTNPVIVFIHGFPFDKSMWDPQLEVLSRKYRCIAFDLPGFGQTPQDGDISIESYADLLDQFMHLMQIPNAIICGLSMGGYIALRAIIKFPERFSSLILCDTQCIADSDEGRKKRFSAIDAIEKNGLPAWAEGFIKNIFTEKNLTEGTPYIHSIHQTILSTSPQSVTGTLKALAERNETCSGLDGIKIPVLILCGEEDKVTPVKQSEYMRDHLQNSTYVAIPQAAHLSNLEQPELFNAAIEKFLG